MTKKNLNRASFSGNRREIIKCVTIGAVAAAGVFGGGLSSKTWGRAQANQPKTIKMAFIQFQPHTVSTAWAKGIQEVLSIQPNTKFQLLDGQAKADVQISLMDTVINDGVNVIFVQPVDSVGLAPSIKKAAKAGIPVITLNIDSTAEHAAHVEMNHYYGAIEIAKAMGAMLGGKGNVAILNAPPGIIIRDQRTNGFVDGMKKNFPDIKIVADQVADWDRKKAQDVLATILTANPDLAGVYGVNDSMALGAMDVAKAEGSQIGDFRQRRRKRRARSNRGGRPFRYAIHRRVPARPFRRGGRDSFGDGRRSGDSFHRAGPFVDAIRDRDEGQCRNHPSLSALVTCALTTLRAAPASPAPPPCSSDILDECSQRR